MIGVLLFSFLGIAILAQVLTQQEQKQQTQRLLSQGSYLVSLIALHRTDDFTGNKGDFFLRTLTEYVSAEGLVYCFIHDHTGSLLASLGRHDLVSKIPTDVQRESLLTSGFSTQTFLLKGPDLTIYEFSKPIFEKAQRSGTVRLGFQLPPPALFSLERVRLLAIIAFVIFTMVAFCYYGIIVALRRVNNLHLKLRNMFTDSAPEQTLHRNITGVDQVVDDLEQSLILFKQRMKNIESSKIEMEAKFCVTAYEKNQIMTILDSMKSGIIVTDSQDNIMHINSYMLALLNRKREDMIDYPVGETLGHEELTSFVSRQGTEEQDRAMGTAELSFPEVIPGNVFRVSSPYLKDPEGTVTGKIILVENISNEKLAEKAQQNFIAHVTHELFTPLTTIKSYNEMLMTGEVQEGDTQREFFNTILEETDRLQRLIENLLNISKIEMGGLTLDRGLVKSDWLVHDCIAAIETVARKKHIALEKYLPDIFPSLFGDKELLKVAIINVLGNAVKYTPEHGKISFALGDTDGMATFEIRDNGYGIGEEDLPHIFSKFYRSKDPRVVEQTGSGLGLGISSEIISLHGGKIYARSAPGKGTHFTISLPKEEYHIGKQ